MFGFAWVWRNRYAKFSYTSGGKSGDLDILQELDSSAAIIW